jgi:hypothetical protein
VSISHSVPGAAPAQVVADAVGSVRGLSELLWSARSEDQLVAVVEQVQVLGSVLCAVEASAITEVEVRGVAKDRLHYGSTGDRLTHVGGLLRARGEKVLVARAGGLDATDLARAGRHLVDVVDPAGEDRRLERQPDRDEGAAHAGRFLAITDDGAGGVRVKGYGSIEDGALLKAALMPLTCPNPATHPTPPHRRRRRRRRR